MLVTALLACRKVEEIPEDLDGAMHWVWQNLDGAEDADLAIGVENLDAALGGATLDDRFDGSVSRLTREEVAFLGLTDRDPGEAAGIFLGNPIACGLGTMAEILVEPAQDVLYEGVYDSYARTFDGDPDAFLAGGVDTLRWEVDYGASVIGSSYTAHTVALLRRIPGTAFGDAYVARYFAPEPAVFEEGSSKTFEQDYQLEIYWSRTTGETLHAYAMWREADWGSGFTSEGEDVQRLLLNAMADWDDDTEKICESGGP